MSRSLRRVLVPSATHATPLCLPAVEQCVPSKAENGGKKSDYGGRKDAAIQEAYQPAFAV